MNVYPVFFDRHNQMGQPRNEMSDGVKQAIPIQGIAAVQRQKDADHRNAPGRHAYQGNGTHVFHSLEKPDGLQSGSHHHGKKQNHTPAENLVGAKSETQDSHSPCGNQKQKQPGKQNQVIGMLNFLEILRNGNPPGVGQLKAILHHHLAVQNQIQCARKLPVALRGQGPCHKGNRNQRNNGVEYLHQHQPDAVFEDFVIGNGSHVHFAAHFRFMIFSITANPRARWAARDWTGQRRPSGPWGMGSSA